MKRSGLRDDEEETPQEPPEPPRLRRLRLLVTALTATLILGVVAIAAALVTRLALTPPPLPPAFAPETLSAARVAVPTGETIVAVGGAGRALLLVTRDARGREWLRRVDSATGATLGVTEIERR